MTEKKMLRAIVDLLESFNGQERRRGVARCQFFSRYFASEFHRLESLFLIKTITETRCE